MDSLSRYNNYNIIESNNYLSTLKPLQHKKYYKDYKDYKDDDKYIFNIIDGILEHRVNSCGIITFIGKELLKNKYININIKNNIAFSIKWEYIFKNIANYIPKLKIL